VLERVELGAGMWPFAAHDDAHALGPAGQVQQPGQFGHIGAVAHAAVGLDRRRPGPLEQGGDRDPDRLGDRPPNRVALTLLGQIPQQGVGEPGAVAAHEDRLIPPHVRDLGYGQVEQFDVVGRGV